VLLLIHFENLIRPLSPYLLVSSLCKDTAVFLLYRNFQFVAFLANLVSNRNSGSYLEISKETLYIFNVGPEVNMDRVKPFGSGWVTNFSHLVVGLGPGYKLYFFPVNVC